MNTQPNTTALEVNPGDWRAIDAGSAAQWQNVIASHKELVDAIREALVSCRELRQHLRDVQAEVQHGA